MKRTGSILMLLAASSAGFAEDPFADVRPAAPRAAEASAGGWADNLLIRKEAFALVAAGEEGVRETDRMSARISAGFEVQKRFATATKTVASANYQGRVVYRDGELDTAADPMGRMADRWEWETHNAYAEFYQLAGGPGRFNLRAGRFYLPFGLNAQTDTHGTLLQLSNDRTFGTDRDWQVVAFGNATERLDYMAGYVMGTGPEQQWDGQAGMAAGRLGLNNGYLFAHGLEGGVSAAFGERIDPHAAHPGATKTWRAGADFRKRFDSGMGSYTLTGEGALGEDEGEAVWSGLAQGDWLHPGRRWGAGAQYVYFEREAEGSDSVDERATALLTRYFRNDVGNAALHWIALAVECRIRTPEGDGDALAMAQYYRYW